VSLSQPILDTDRYRRVDSSHKSLLSQLSKFLGWFHTVFEVIIMERFNRGSLSNKPVLYLASSNFTTVDEMISQHSLVNERITFVATTEHTTVSVFSI
jgi:hypothetical protein